MRADADAGWPARVSRGRARVAAAAGDDGAYQLCWRDADGHAISRNYLDAEAAHPAAQLGKDFVAGVALHAV